MTTPPKTKEQILEEWKHEIVWGSLIEPPDIAIGTSKQALLLLVSMAQDAEKNRCKNIAISMAGAAMSEDYGDFKHALGYRIAKEIERSEP